MQESYPSTPPIWFVDSDDPSLAEVLERLEDVRKGSTLVSWLQLHREACSKMVMSHMFNTITVGTCKDCSVGGLVVFVFMLHLADFYPQLLQQLKRLICDLCRLYNLPQHPDVEMLDQPLPAGPITQERKVLSENKSKIQRLFVAFENSTMFHHTTARATG